MDSELGKFLKSQIGEIEKYKWIESEKAGRDLGEFAVKDWINKYSLCFRKSWESKDEKQQRL